MKFMYFFLPSIPATPQERKDLRPIAHRTERCKKCLTKSSRFRAWWKTWASPESASPSTICIPKAWKSGVCPF